MSTPSFNIGFYPAMSKLYWEKEEDVHAARKFLQEPVTIISARNEVVGVQIQLSSEQDFVLAFDHTNWLHPSGFCQRFRMKVHFPSLLTGSFEIFPIGYIKGDDQREWMETLDHSGYIEVPAGRPQAVYIRIFVPSSLEPGTYPVSVQLYTQYGFEDEILSWEGSFHLQVMDVSLPDPGDWSFHLNLWQHCTSIARYYHVTLWSEVHFALIERYYASLSKLGQKAVSIIAAEIPWSGQRCYRETDYPSYLFEHAVIDVTRDSNGSLHFDFTKMDRLLDLAARYGMDQDIDIFGLLNIWVDDEYGFGKVAPDAPDAIRLRCFDEPSGRMVYIRKASELSDFIRQLQAHFAEMNLLERVRITADEPTDIHTFLDKLEFIHHSAPKFKYSVFINHIEFIEQAPEAVNDFVPVLPLICLDLEKTRQFIDLAHHRNGRVEFYVCCWPPIPNTFLHSPLVEGQLFGWLTYKLNLDGFIRWAYCLWPADPWKQVSWRAPFWSAGDMYFVLPGNDGAPVETLRYEAVRMAVQDYELLKLVERSLPAGEALDVIERAFSLILHTGSLETFILDGSIPAEDLYSLDPEDYQIARRLLLEALQKYRS